MTNRLDERKSSYAVIIAAVVTSLVIMVGGMASGLTLAVRVRRESEAMSGEKAMAGYLLTDSAYNLKTSMSALRLCNEDEVADDLCHAALMHAVRAETALECYYGEWADARNKEAFLNDISAVLFSAEPGELMEKSDVMYEYASRFYDCVTSGEEFEYNGELMSAKQNDHEDDITDDDIASASEVVKKGTSADKIEYLGDWHGHIEYHIEVDGASGYAVVCGDKVIEYSLMREDGGVATDEDEAKKVALSASEACGFGGLTVKRCYSTGSSVVVGMCKSYHGALACDDCATAVVYGGKVVAFSSGECEHEHKNIPSVKKTEEEARNALKDAQGKTGTLVVRTVGGRERVCYEYTVELDDGVHYVYVCAENGRQMEIK